jgi:hypothetical protein
MAEGFWKTALKVAGLAAIALFVLYKLYDRILGLGLLIGLSQLQSFIIVVLLAVLIFFVAIFSIWIWYLNNRNEAGQKSRLPEIHRRDMEIGIDFEIPPNCTFRTASTALASTDKSTINFSGFYKRELNASLRPQKLSTNTTKAALERIGDIARVPVRPYKVTKRQGRYELTVVKGDAP